METSNLSCRSLSEDLWIEIFKRSSVKSVCALRCVCKSWNSLISSNYFINLHHTFNLSSTPDNLKTYIRVKIWSRFDYPLFVPNPSTHQLHFPFKSLARTIGGGVEKILTMVDVIHGVICLSYGLKSSFDSTLLWNPGIRKYLALPLLSFPKSKNYSDSSNRYLSRQIRFLHNKIGFGYDMSKNDFKVVRIWMPNNQIRRWCPYLKLRYDVYSSRRGFWKSGMLLPDHLQSSEPMDCIKGSYFNGSIYWLIKRSLLLFDCVSEEFKSMELPQELQDAQRIDWGWTVQLFGYAGMLAAVLPSIGNDYYDHKMVVLWVMEKNGTWNKLYKISKFTSELELNDFHLCQPSFVNNLSRYPCILDEWIRFHPLEYVSRLYEQTLLLMDHPSVQSYSEEDSDD